MRKAAQADQGLAQIEDLERRINLAFEENGKFYQIAEAELARFRAGVQRQARAICDGLRKEYLARRG